MSIGIDARLAGETGLGRYVTRLIHELAVAAPNEDITLFVGADGETRFGTLPFRRVAAPVRWYTLAEQGIMPRLIKEANIALFHAPHWNVPLWMPVPFVVTIHDLILLRHPSLRATTLGPVQYAVKSVGHRLVLHHAVNAARRVIAVSQATRQALIAYQPGAAGKIAVVYEGGGLQTLPRATNPGRHLLYVGNAYPHKRIEDVLGLVQRLRAMPDMADIRLVWIGQDDYFSKQVRERPAWRELGGAAEFRGPANDAALAAAYQTAGVLVSASAEEGFGLPPLEAMGAGVPVVVTDIPAHAEIVADAGWYFPVGNVSAAADAVAHVFRFPNEAAERVARGRERARTFSWQRMAQDTLAIYRDVRSSS